MSGEPNVLRTLIRKRNEIENAIVTYEKRLADARRDLAHVTATIHLFESAAGTGDVRVYQDIHRLFQRFELVNLCKAALAKNGPMTTPELARYVVTVKAFDPIDDVLRQAITFKIVQALRLQHKRGRIGDAGRRGQTRVWRIQT